MPGGTQDVFPFNMNNFYDSIDRASLLTNEADKNTIKLESDNNSIVVSDTLTGSPEALLMRKISLFSTVLLTRFSNFSQ